MPTLTAQSSTVRRLELETTGEPDTLHRVLIWLRRRGCTLTRVDFVAEDRHGPGRFVVSVQAPPRHDDRLDRGLRAIVGVIAVNVD
jgi:acetolactate synthase regulatory subunit